jgi:hypothetical protein
VESSLVDRLADTTAFRVLLGLAACTVLPVLGVGVLVTAIGGPVLVGAPQRIEAGQVAFGLLALGGALGMVGWVRALIGVRAPVRHNVAATLLMLAAGILAALTVAGFVALVVIEAALLRVWPDTAAWLGLGALFVAANVVWALAGVASMQRLLRRYAETTGRSFDSLPVVLLSVAMALAAAAALATVLTL